MSLFGSSDVRLPELQPLFSSTATTAARATLTILADGRIVLGCPEDVTSEWRAEYATLIAQWAKSEGASLVLPWPVDVDDQRETQP